MTTTTDAGVALCAVCQKPALPGSNGRQPRYCSRSCYLASVRKDSRKHITRNRPKKPTREMSGSEVDRFLRAAVRRECAMPWEKLEGKP